MKAVVFLVLALFLLGRAATPTSAAAIDGALGAVLQADGPRLTEELAALSSQSLSAKDRQLSLCIADRLQGRDRRPVSASPLIRQVILAYRTYWRQATVAGDHGLAAEPALVVQLGKILGRPDLPAMDVIEPVLNKALRREGVWSLQGKTGALRDLMIWARQKTLHRQVTLPEGHWRTSVFVLDDFLSPGWSRYLSCGRTGTGGWAKPEGLYVVLPAYKTLEGEPFRVSFLAHETQHFSDMARFPNLKSWEKEYRAKLVELTYARKTLDSTLRRFARDQADDPDLPHSYANKQILAVLRTRLDLPADGDPAAVPPERLHQAAAAELMADSERRLAAVTDH